MTRQKMALSELFNIGSSKRVLQSQWRSEGVPFYRGREITKLALDGFVDNELFISEEQYREYAEKYGVPQCDDIMITAIGTIGNSYIVKEGNRFYFKDASVLWLKKVADVNSDFINLWLKSPKFFDQLDKGNGATVDTLTIQKLKSVIVDLPPLPEQQRIVGILDEAFDGIATAKANTEKNLQNARALFESHLQAVFSQRGEGWMETSLSGCCFKILAGGDVPKGRVSQEPTTQYSIPIYSNGAKNEGLYGYTDTASVLKPSVTISARGTIGFSAIRIEPFLPVVRLIVLIPDEEKVDLSFLYYTVMGMDFGNTGTSIPQLTVPNLKERKICIPPVNQQKEIVANLDVFRDETQRLESIYQQKLAALDELKKSLLDQAFTGQL
jgi:type I restriction enzyme S subunit